MWKNLKVVELASVLAGPLVGSFFSELGAAVIKIENKQTGGDVTRTWKLSTESKENSISAYYASANFGKRSVFLNLKEEEDYQQCIAFIKEADIVIQNFKTGDAQKLQLDAEHLRKLKPDLIVASLTGFGENSDRPAFDVVLQAETGFMYMNGTKESGPIKMPVALIDVLAAHHLKEAILIALVEKSLSRKGKTISISLYDSAIASLANQASNYLMEGHVPQAMGTQHPNIAPYGDMYLTKDDRNIVLAIGNDQQFARLCSLLGIQKNDWEIFTSNEERLANRASLNLLLGQHFSNYKLADLSERLLEAKIPFGQVKDLAEVFNGLGAKKMIQEEVQDGILKKRVKTLLS